MERRKWSMWYLFIMIQNTSKLFCLGHAISNSSTNMPCLKYLWQWLSNYYFPKSSTLMDGDDFVWPSSQLVQRTVIWTSRPNRALHTVLPFHANQHCVVQREHTCACVCKGRVCIILNWKAFLLRKTRKNSKKKYQRWTIGHRKLLLYNF